MELNEWNDDEGLLLKTASEMQVAPRILSVGVVLTVQFVSNQVVSKKSQRSLQVIFK